MEEPEILLNQSYLEQW